MVAPPVRELSQIGMTMWLDTIVESAIEATMTIDVAEENPPKNDPPSLIFEKRIA